MALHITKLIGSDTSEVQIASGEITITGMHHTVESETGSADTLDTILIDATLLASMSGRGFFIVLLAATGHTITVSSASGIDPGEIVTTDGRDFDMTDSRPLLLWYDPTYEAFLAFGAVTVPSGTLVTETGAATLTNKNLTAPVISDPIITYPSADYASGAIAIKSGNAWLTGGSPVTYTLANPVNGSDDDKELTIISTTAQAHKVDYSAGSGFNGGGASVDFANFGGAVGDNITLIARGGVWYVKRTLNVTIAAS